MHKNFILLTALYLAVFAWGIEPAKAQVIGANCTAAQIGTSAMTADRKHIVACLIKDTTAGQEWKAFSASSQESGSYCGYFPTKTGCTSLGGGDETCWVRADPTNGMIPCTSTPVYVTKKGAAPISPAVTCLYPCALAMGEYYLSYLQSSCPTGYTLKTLGSVSTVKEQSGTSLTAHALSCIKN